ncbi:MAG: BatA and WFA domain-containing protein [Nanoarchaeota archaeon]
MIFSNPVGLWALLGLVPFILIYLIKPKPKDQVIPSLMFLIKEQQSFKQNAFLRKLLRNLLFLLQILALLGLIFSIASPFIEVPYSVASDNTVIVLDSSASMQTKFGQKTRFERAVDTAKNSLSGKISIILAENIPLTVLKDGDVFEAKVVLSNLNPKATSTNIGDALLLAEDILKEKKGRIIVLSDFLQTEGSDLLVVKRALVAKGNKVDFIEISNEANNIGIVDLAITKHLTKVYIKNFNEAEAELVVKLLKDKEVLGSETISFLPGSLESLVFETPTDISQIVLELNDDLMVDNVAYISAPSKKQTDVLLITNKEKSSLMAALGSSKDIALSVSHPPLSHMVDGNQVKFSDFDVIILAEVGKVGEKEGLLKGNFKDMDDYIASGGFLIIAASDNLAELPTTDLGREIFNEILPVRLTGFGNSSRLCFKIFNQFTSQFQNIECPAVIDNYLISEAKNSSVVIAQANDGSPLLSQQGNVFYYGVIDDKSDFKTLTSYPIFWNELISFLVRTEDITDYNYKSGTLVALSKQSVKTPTTNMATSQLILDEHGIYEFNSKKVAVNLLNEKESDVNKKSDIVIEDSSFEESTEQKKKKIELEIYLLILIILLLLTELFYIKGRGDL